MGFRSLLIMETPIQDWPQDFIEKYEPCVNIDGYALSSKFEGKVYGGFPLQTIVADIQAFLPEDEHAVGVYLHECGGITRVEIHEDEVLWTEPDGWRFAQGGPMHDYCYGCSDARRVEGTD